MNIENTEHKALGRLKSKAQWRTWVKGQTLESGSSLFSVDHLQILLKQWAKPQSIWGAFQALTPEPVVNWAHLAPEKNLKWAFPKVSGDSGMEFYRTETFTPHPRFGMLEPDLAKSTPVDKAELAGIFVPGLAFDNRGFRLGRGKGFYDRFLSDFKGLKIGLCSHKLFVLGPLPKDTWDVGMDYVVTDEFIFKAE